MKIALMVLVLGLISAKSLFAADSKGVTDSEKYGIFGWDIACRGADGLKVKAYQSDDDFYIEYQGAKLAKDNVWADSTSQWDLRYKNLLFTTNQGPADLPAIALSIVRNNLDGFGHGTGVLVVNRNRYDLNCYVRFGVGDDDFDKISKKPFPPIAVPKSLK